jgi:hypothetical protein
LAVVNLLPKQTSSQNVKVEVVGKIPSDFDTGSLALLNDSTKTRDFTVTLDLSAGLGNQAVFGQ